MVERLPRGGRPSTGDPSTFSGEPDPCDARAPAALSRISGSKDQKVGPYSVLGIGSAREELDAARTENDRRVNSGRRVQGMKSRSS
uniref:Uncharacterized protein n=1 Tax=Sphaerodactylus townsendi TaxID=933632 RepID=A0ACB8F678_9SAUR